MGPSTSPIAKTQPQIAQLELMFAGPLVKGSMVNTLADLLTLKFNYDQKLIWVKSEKSNYLLINGDGSDINHWEKLSQKVTIKPYNQTQTYLQYEMVYQPGKLFVALQDVPVNKNPVDNQDFWLTLSGDIPSKRFIFEEESNVIVYVDIVNPQFQIIIGEIEKDSDDEYVIGDDGLINILNPEIVDAYIVRRTDLPNNSGRAYEIIFEENSEPVLFSGAINVK